jgi:hypothetical protein
MVMTEAPSDAIGLSERLRDPNAAYTEHSDGDPDLGRYIRWLKSLGEEAATALDALSADNEHMAETILKLNEYLADANARALRAEQQRDEAYERAAQCAECIADEYDATSFTSVVAGQVAALRSKEQAAHEIAAAIRRLAAGTEKEGE